MKTETREDAKKRWAKNLQKYIDQNNKRCTPGNLPECLTCLTPVQTTVWARGRYCSHACYAGAYFSRTGK